MHLPQFSLKTLLWMMACACGFIAIVSAAPEEDRVVATIGLLWAISPLASGIALAVNAGRSKSVTIVGWAVACLSLAAMVGLVAMAIVQEP